MTIENDQDLARGCPPPGVASACPAFADAPPTGMLWNDQGYRWNGFDSWSAKVENYLQSGFIEPAERPGFARAVFNFQSFGQSQLESVQQFEDGELIVTAGPLYSVIDLAAAFRRLEEETAFTIGDSLMVIDPRERGKGFFVQKKIEHIDGASLEYRVSGENAEHCMNMFNQIRALLKEARAVLDGEFFVALDNPGSWGLTTSGTARARAHKPLTQSDLIILKPIV